MQTECIKRSLNKFLTTLAFQSLMNSILHIVFVQSEFYRIVVGCRRRTASLYLTILSFKFIGEMTEQFQLESITDYL